MFFTRPEREYLDASRFKRGVIKTGDRFCTDSGLGGVFDVEFLGFENEKLLFKPLNKGFTAWRFRYSLEDVNHKVFLLKEP